MNEVSEVDFFWNLTSSRGPFPVSNDVFFPFSRQFGDLFDKVDVTKEGTVDWDKFASHMLLEFYERDDRVKSTQVPQWKDLKNLSR